jgi:hypothetical protein
LYISYPELVLVDQVGKVVLVGKVDRVVLVAMFVQVE